jgi:hypothetical protein
MSLPDDLLKNLPVTEIYRDAAKPAVRQVGGALEATVKAARFLLAPVEYVAAWNDRWQRYLERISKKVSEKNLIDANPEITGPILLPLLHAKEEGLQAEMFLNLLARAIDRERANEAHPAYGQIVSQLHPDEAVILYHLKKKWFEYVQRATYNSVNNTFGPRELVSNTFPVTDLAFSQNFETYMDHLYTLGVAWVRQIGNQQTTYDGPPGVQTGVIIRNAIELMTFGAKFAQACVPDNLPDK